jgi:hypothetical protein
MTGNEVLTFRGLIKLGIAKPSKKSKKKSKKRMASNEVQTPEPSAPEPSAPGAYSRTHIDRLEEKRREKGPPHGFPLSFKLEPDNPKSRRVWWQKEVVEWLESRAARRTLVTETRAEAVETR